MVAHYAINLRQLRTAEAQGDWLEYRRPSDGRPDS